MTQLTSFQLFLKTNKLKQKQIAEYLGTSPQYINQVARGVCNLSDEKYELLLQGDWDTSMLNIPYYIKDKNRTDCIPILPFNTINTAEINIQKFIKENGNKLKQISLNKLVQYANCAEQVCTTAMVPTFTPGDMIFIRFLSDKTSIIDGDIYYFNMKTLPNMIRKVKINGDQLLLIANNPAFEDISISYDEIFNIADIVGLFRSSFDYQHADIEVIRKEFDSRIDKLIDVNGKILQSMSDLIAVIKNNTAQ